MRLSAPLACAALAIALLGAQGASPLPSASPSASPAPTATAAPLIVHIKNFSYVPRTLTIQAGQTVEWVNDDAQPHSATADDGSWDSGELDQGQSWSSQFANPGTYRYHCDEHEFMKGTIVVK
jgi:plastocyanin